MTEWRAVHVGFEGDDVEVAGLRIWGQTWRRGSSEPVLLPHPAHPHQTHRYNVYEIGPAEAPARFAASELSNGVWGFYIPKEDWRYRIVDVIASPGTWTTLLLDGPTDLPKGTRVTLRLTTPTMDVIETTAVKDWDVPVGGLSQRHDAFLIPAVDDQLLAGSLVEVDPVAAT